MKQERNLSFVDSLLLDVDSGQTTAMLDLGFLCRPVNREEAFDV